MLNKIQNIVQSAWEWLVFSSKDADKWSLTLKAGVPYILILLSWKGLSVDGNLIGQFIDISVNVIVAIVQLGTMLATLFGLGRKIYLSLKKITGA